MGNQASNLGPARGEHQKAHRQRQRVVRAMRARGRSKGRDAADEPFQASNLDPGGESPIPFIPGESQAEGPLGPGGEEPNPTQTGYIPRPHSSGHHHKRKLSAAEILAIVSGSLVLLLLLLSLVANVDRMSKRRTKRR